MQVLADRVLRQHTEGGLNEAWHGELLDLLAPVMCAFDADMAADALLVQGAIYAANVLALTLGPAYPKAFNCLVDPVTTLLNRAVVEPRLWPVVSNALACLGTLFSTLGPRLMAQLPTAASAVVGAIRVSLAMDADGSESESEGEDEGEGGNMDGVTSAGSAADGSVLQVSGLAAVHALVQHLGQFLGPHLDDVMAIVSADAFCGGAGVSIVADEEDSRPAAAEAVSTTLASLVAKAAAIREDIATLVPTRIFLASLYSVYRKATAAGLGANVGAMSRFLGMASHGVAALDRSAVQQQHKHLFAFLLEALDARSAMAADAEAKEAKRVDGRGAEEEAATATALNALEDAALDCVKELVLKLSDSAFRPMFTKLLSWATGVASTPARLLTLYRLVNLLTDTLQRFFVPYFAALVEGCVGLLQGGAAEVCSTSAEAGRLTASVLDALRKAFLYDRNNLVNDTRYRMLMPAIVDQLSPAPGADVSGHAGAEAHLTRVRAVVVPCITQLAVAAGEEKLWKPMNDLILMQTRHPAPAVRRGGLIALKALHERLGEELLSLLTDTVPFLAELLEGACPEPLPCMYACMRACMQVCICKQLRIHAHGACRHLRITFAPPPRWHSTIDVHACRVACLFLGDNALGASPFGAFC